MNALLSDSCCAVGLVLGAVGVLSVGLGVTLSAARSWMWNRRVHGAQRDQK